MTLLEGLGEPLDLFERIAGFAERSDPWEIDAWTVFVCAITITKRQIGASSASGRGKRLNLQRLGCKER